MYLTRYTTFISSKKLLRVRHRGLKAQHINLGDAVQCLCVLRVSVIVSRCDCHSRTFSRNHQPFERKFS